MGYSFIKRYIEVLTEPFNDLENEYLAHDNLHRNMYELQPIHLA